MRAVRRRGPAARRHAPPARGPDGPRSPGLACRREGARSVVVGLGRGRSSRGVGVAADAPAEPGAAPDRRSSAGFTTPVAVPAAGELHRSAFAAPEAAGASGGSAARPRRSRSRASGPRPPTPATFVGAGGREAPRSAEVGLAVIRRLGGGVCPGAPRPNQALHPTATHRLVARPLSPFRRRVSLVVRPSAQCGPLKRSGDSAARPRASPSRAFRHASPTAGEARTRGRPRRRTKRVGGVRPG